MDKEQLVSGMVRYASGSMHWCALESEKAVSSVMEVMDQLMNDAHRISSMSEDTLGAVRDFRQTVVSLQGEFESNDLEKEIHATHILIRELSRLTHEHEEVAELVRPIIEVLQFQDRITQNMENMRGMLEVWQSTRQQVENTGRFTAQDRIAFGQALYQCSTMEEERRPLRSLFDGLPAERHKVFSEDDEIFF